MDGQKQRQALTAAERALRSLADGNHGSRSLEAARKAIALDQVGLFTGLERAVARAVDEISASGSVSEGTRQQLLDVVGPGPLQAMVAEIPSQ